jgi:hypothetical protein
VITQVCCSNGTDRSSEIGPVKTKNAPEHQYRKLQSHDGNSLYIQISIKNPRQKTIKSDHLRFCERGGISDRVVLLARSALFSEPATDLALLLAMTASKLVGDGSIEVVVGST